MSLLLPPHTWPETKKKWKVSQDCTILIFTHLPRWELFRGCRRVSKTWQKWVDCSLKLVKWATFVTPVVQQVAQQIGDWDRDLEQQLSHLSSLTRLSLFETPEPQLRRLQQLDKYPNCTPVTRFNARGQVTTAEMWRRMLPRCSELQELCWAIRLPAANGDGDDDQSKSLAIDFQRKCCVLMRCMSDWPRLVHLVIAAQIDKASATESIANVVSNWLPRLTSLNLEATPLTVAHFNWAIHTCPITLKTLKLCIYLDPDSLNEQVQFQQVCQRLVQTKKEQQQLHELKIHIVPIVPTTGRPSLAVLSSIQKTTLFGLLDLPGVWNWLVRMKHVFLTLEPWKKDQAILFIDDAHFFYMFEHVQTGRDYLSRLEFPIDKKIQEARVDFNGHASASEFQDLSALVQLRFHSCCRKIEFTSKSRSFDWPTTLSNTLQSISRLFF